MDTRRNYFKDAPQILERALTIYNKKKVDLEQDIQIIREWLRTQPHLPETPNDHMITTFLLMNKFSIEKTKRNIDMYYTLRTYIPELFKNCHPELPHMQFVMDKVYWIPLPKTSREGYRVHILHVEAYEDPNQFNYRYNTAHTFNVCEVRMREDLMIGDIFIFDFDNIKASYLLQATPSILKKVATVLDEVYNNIVRQIHFINYPQFAEPVITMAKKIINPKLVQRFHFHKEVKTLMNFVPADILPKDYGGEEISLKELNEIWKQKLADYKERFDFLEKMEVDEKKRPTPLTNDDNFGFYGNFKQLNVD